MKITEAVNPKGQIIKVGDTVKLDVQWSNYRGQTCEVLKIRIDDKYSGGYKVKYKMQGVVTAHYISIDLVVLVKD